MKVTLDENKLNVTVKEQNLTLKSPVGIVPHSATHKSGGSDEIKLDELGMPSDNTNLNATIERHGLLPKLPNDANKFLNGIGGWSEIQIPELDWGNIVNKPASYPPEEHSHTWDEVSNKPITYPPDTHGHAWSEISNKPSEYPPQSHTHSQSDITNLLSDLDELRRLAFFYGV